jgi:hypothetical protein
MKLQNLIHILIGILCIGLLPRAQAVVPPPDGGYPNFTTAEGTKALQSLTTGAANTAVGWFSLFGTSSGSFNTAVGAGALDLNTADNNTAVGVAALLLNTTGTENTANGRAALEFNDTGANNTAVGSKALLSNTNGNGNTANGVEALFANTTGNANTAIGVRALLNSTGSGNTALGFQAGSGVTTASNVIVIGATAGGANVSNSCFIGQIRGVTTANADAIPVLIDSNGQLGTASSSRRFKNEINPMDQASQVILGLKPVTFHYKNDSKGTPQFGLIAEEVAGVSPDLVVRDENGEIYTVRYDAVNAMLLNEFLKEHQKVQEQQATITELKSTVAQQQKDFQGTVARLAARLDEQAAQIQKVSAQLELSKSAPQVVNNP